MNCPVRWVIPKVNVNSLTRVCLLLTLKLRYCLPLLQCSEITVVLHEIFED
jgi:hypothetical protein